MDKLKNILMIILYIILSLLGFWIIWIIYKKYFFIPKSQNEDEIFTPNQIIEYAKQIQNELGSSWGWNWSFTENDEKAAQMIIVLNKINFEGVKLAYKQLFERNLVDDCNELIDDDIKEKYKNLLSTKGIF